MVTNLPPPVPRNINRKPELMVNTLEEVRFLGYAPIHNAQSKNVLTPSSES
jgi:hypothetical protein